MQEVLTVPVPSEIRHLLNRTTQKLARDMRSYSALMLFQLGKLPSGAAAEMAGVPPWAQADGLLSPMLVRIKAALLDAPNAQGFYLNSKLDQDILSLAGEA